VAFHDRRSEGTYDQGEIEALWDTMVECYGGSEERAAAACKQVRGSVICPLYASPDLLKTSLAALVDVIGEEEADEILTKNPAVLTCGEGLRTADPGEIRRLANLRQVLDGIPPSALLGTIVLFAGVIITKIVLIKLGLSDPIY
jgi:hypothetical protein